MHVDESPSAAVELPWGQVPPQIVQVVQLLVDRVANSERHLKKRAWPDGPGDVQTILRLSIGDAHKIVKAGTDLRALLTAYAHQFHEPRPVMADLARAQGATPQGIPRRYGASHVEGIRQLLSDQPDTAAILLAYPSLSLKDLATLPGAVGVVATRQAAGEVEFSHPRWKRRKDPDVRRIDLPALPPLHPGGDQEGDDE